MDRYVLIIDTETANSVDQPMPYDFGWAIVDTFSKKIVETYSYVVAEIFLDKELMSQAYFADKVPAYWEDIKANKRTLTSLINVRKTLWASMKAYDITQVGAYNMGFDRKASNNDIRYITGSWLRWFFPFKVDYFCIWHMACTSILNTKEYVNFALANGFLTEKGNIKTSAECAYRFIIDNPSFVESHTGLEDVQIEAEILFHCLEVGDENMKTTIYPSCWRYPQKVRKTMAVI